MRVEEREAEARERRQLCPDVVDADGGRPRQITHEASMDSGTCWDPMGRWLYFSSNRSGRHEIWKVPTQGGPAQQVTRGGGINCEVSRDGRHLYYLRSSTRRSLWRLSLEGGEDKEMVAGPLHDDHSIAVSAGGVYYATSRPLTRGEAYAIHYLDFETGRAVELFRREGLYSHMRLAVSPDEEWIAFNEAPLGTSELMLVENFR